MQPAHNYGGLSQYLTPHERVGYGLLGLLALILLAGSIYGLATYTPGVFNPGFDSKTVFFEKLGGGAFISTAIISAIAAVFLFKVAKQGQLEASREERLEKAVLAIMSVVGYAVLTVLVTVLLSTGPDLFAGKIPKDDFPHACVEFSMTSLSAALVAICFLVHAHKRARLIENDIPGLAI